MSAPLVTGIIVILTLLGLCGFTMVDAIRYVVKANREDDGTDYDI